VRVPALGGGLAQLDRVLAAIAARVITPPNWHKRLTEEGEFRKPSVEVKQDPFEQEAQSLAMAGTTKCNGGVTESARSAKVRAIDKGGDRLIYQHVLGWSDWKIDCFSQQRMRLNQINL